MGFFVPVDRFLGVTIPRFSVPVSGRRFVSTLKILYTSISKSGDTNSP